MILQGDQQPFDRPQRQQRRNQDQRNPQHCMHPQRRRIESFAGQRRAATTKPEKNITKNAGPSAESANEKSSPQLSQRGLSVRKPANKCPLPQRGQRPASPLRMGTRSDERSSAAMPSIYAPMPRTEGVSLRRPQWPAAEWAPAPHT